MLCISWVNQKSAVEYILVDVSFLFMCCLWVYLLAGWLAAILLLAAVVDFALLATVMYEEGDVFEEMWLKLFIMYIIWVWRVEERKTIIINNIYIKWKYGKTLTIFCECVFREHLIWRCRTSVFNWNALDRLERCCSGGAISE